MGIGQQGSTETTGQRPGDSTSVTTGHPVYSIRQPWGSERGAPWPSGPCSGGGVSLAPSPACGPASSEPSASSGLPAPPLADHGWGCTPPWATGPLIKWGSWSRSGVFTFRGLTLRI